MTHFSLWPSHLDTRSADDTEKKVASTSVATALAKYDLPVPGGYAYKHKLVWHAMRVFADPKQQDAAPRDALPGE